MVGYDEQNVSPIVIARSVSDEAIQPRARNWIASLALAMTGRQVPCGANERMKVIGLAGWSGAGKTTLLTRVLPYLLDEGLRVSVIKHAHHHFDVDVPGKDSWRHREAGATEVLVSSGKRWALMHELRGAAEPRLPELLSKMARVDLVVVEGYKSEPHRKIEVFRTTNGKPLLFPDDDWIVGIATDTAVETRLPTAHLDDIPAIAAMMRRLAMSIEDVLAHSEADS
jgi:molybdopterin-guanine dinucleotide biosynthesis adapter protein